MSNDSDLPPGDSAAPLTALLHAAHAGDRAAGDRAYALLYPELRKIARARLRVHQPNTLLDTHALVHESFLHLVRAEGFAFDDRHHFYAYAAKAMRHIVIDFARRSLATRRGGAMQRVTLNTALSGQVSDAAQALDVESALQALEAVDATLAQVVEMRYFGGYTDGEIAATLDVTDRTVRRYWDKARAFMLVHMAP